MTAKCSKSPTGRHRWSIAFGGVKTYIDCNAKKPWPTDKKKSRKKRRP